MSGETSLSRRSWIMFAFAVVFGSWKLGRSSWIWWLFLRTIFTWRRSSPSSSIQ